MSNRLTIGSRIGIRLTLIMFVASPVLFAAKTFDDIVVSIEAPEHLRYHGYGEFRISAINNSSSQSHTVTFYMPAEVYGHGDYIRRISKTVTLGPSSAANVSLFQPSVRMFGDGLGVIIDGKSQEEYIPIDISSRFSPYGFRSHMGHPMAMNCFLNILISRNVNYDAFQAGMETLFPSSLGARMPGGDAKTWQITKSEIATSGWSVNWLGYSSFDCIVLLSSEMQEMPGPVRTALLRYVQCGGSLLVLGTWSRPEEWNSPVEKYGPLECTYLHFGVCAMAGSSDVSLWQDDIWQSLLSEVWSPSAAEPYNTAQCDGNTLFSVIEGLSIPLRRLFASVLIFSLVIGPVNLIVLSRMKRKIWMLWTVPTVSVAMSLFVFVYALTAEGWRGYSRTRSVTVLDENTHSAATIGVNAFYCPLTPAGGLHYDYETEVTPMGIEEWGSGRPRTIDWTLDQNLSSGWVAARVPAHFLLRKNQLRRERLIFTHDSDGCTVLNGLGCDIKRLTYADENGMIHDAGNIPAGSKVILNNTMITAEGEPNSLRKFFGSNWIRTTEQIMQNPEKYLQKNCYIAVLGNDVFLEQALTNLKSRKFDSIVYGMKKGPENAGESQ